MAKWGARSTQARSTQQRHLGSRQHHGDLRATVTTSTRRSVPKKRDGKERTRACRTTSTSTSGTEAATPDTEVASLPKVLERTRSPPQHARWKRPTTPILTDAVPAGTGAPGRNPAKQEGPRRGRSTPPQRGGHWRRQAPDKRPPG